MSKMPWIRLYREALHDPKTVTLSDKQHRAWINCLLIADDTGLLPSLRDIATHMRVTVTDAEQILVELIDAELIDANVLSVGRTYRIHAWAKRQYPSDSSTERSRKCRAKKRATAVQRCSNGDAAPPDRDSESEKDGEVESPPTPQGAGEGDFTIDWIEDLRAESVTPVVLDHFLMPMLKAGLKPWKDVDPKGPARQLGQDFKRLSGPVLNAAADRLLSTEKYRLPPVAKCREAVAAEGKIAAAKVFSERKQEEVADEVMRFERGTPEYEQELSKWQANDPDFAARIEQRGFVKIKRAEAQFAQSYDQVAAATPAPEQSRYMTSFDRKIEGTRRFQAMSDAFEAATRNGASDSHPTRHMTNFDRKIEGARRFRQLARATARNENSD